MVIRHVWITIDYNSYISLSLFFFNNTNKSLNLCIFDQCEDWLVSEFLVCKSNLKNSRSLPIWFLWLFFKWNLIVKMIMCFWDDKAAEKGGGEEEERGGEGRGGAGKNIQ